MSAQFNLIQYIKDSKEELRHVTWPTKHEVKKHTTLVVALSLAMAAFLGAIDYILTIGLEKIIK